MEESMKKMLTLAVLGVAAILGSAATAQAQSTQPTLIATIPFDFTAGTAHFTAGTYEVRDTGDFLTIRDADGKKAAIVRTRYQWGHYAPLRNTLQFRRENGRMHLAGAQSVGNDPRTVVSNH
jgi:hypothetical protein